MEERERERFGTVPVCCAVWVDGGCESDVSPLPSAVSASALAPEKSEGRNAAEVKTRERGRV